MRNKIKVIIALIVIVVFIGILRKVDNEYPLIDKSVFSPESAIKHVEKIAKLPRPSGSKEIDKAKDYIVSRINDLGMEPVIQSKKINYNNKEIEINNIIATKQGINNGDCILIMSHYDSVSTGPGASDAAANIAIVLELLKFVNDNSFENTIIFSFNDAEEIGLEGAKLYAEKSDLSQIKLVINLEARGHKGKSIMFETLNEDYELMKV